MEHLHISRCCAVRPNLQTIAPSSRLPTKFFCPPLFLLILISLVFDVFCVSGIIIFVRFKFFSKVVFLVVPRHDWFLLCSVHDTRNIFQYGKCIVKFLLLLPADVIVNIFE